MTPNLFNSRDQFQQFCNSLETDESVIAAICEVAERENIEPTLDDIEKIWEWGYSEKTTGSEIAELAHNINVIFGGDKQDNLCWGCEII